MKVRSYKLWDRHWIVYLIVKEWRPEFYFFNKRFCRADRMLELAIIDAETYYRVMDE